MGEHSKGVGNLQGQTDTTRKGGKSPAEQKSGKQQPIEPQMSKSESRHAGKQRKFTV